MASFSSESRHGVNLAPGASRQIRLTIDPRIIAEWENGGWSIKGGTYAFALGDSAEALGPVVTVSLKERRWTDQTKAERK